MTLTRKDFLRLSAALPVAAAAAGCASTRQSSQSNRVLIRGADVLSMVSADAEFLRTDVLIEHGRISRIGQGLPAAGASVISAEGMILMPGMIDGHGVRLSNAYSLVAQVGGEHRVYCGFVRYA